MLLSLASCVRYQVNSMWRKDTENFAWLSVLSVWHFILFLLCLFLSVSAVWGKSLVLCLFPLLRLHPLVVLLLSTCTVTLFRAFSTQQITVPCLYSPISTHSKTFSCDVIYDTHFFLLLFSVSRLNAVLFWKIFFLCMTSLFLSVMSPST